MRPKFSEFSYGYALTEALVNGQQHLVRPTFPSLRKEGDTGYDLRLDRPGHPLFLQFKLCNGITRDIAKEISDYKLSLKLPFLRMKLMPEKRSQQHHLLLDLENKDEAVFYAAPRFFCDNVFASHYRNQRILSKSAFVAPSAIGPLPDNGEHHVSFEPEALHGWLLSEPRDVRPIFDGNGLNAAIEQCLSEDKPLSGRVNKALVHVVNSVINATEKEKRLTVVRSIIRNLYQDLMRSNLTNIDTSAIRSLMIQIEDEDRHVFVNKARLQFRNVFADLQDTDTTVEQNQKYIGLLSTLAHLHLDATLVLMTDELKW